MFVDVLKGKVIKGPFIPESDYSPRGVILTYQTAYPDINDRTSRFVADNLEISETKAILNYRAVNFSLERCIANLKEDVSKVRWEKETGGLVLPSGMLLATDRESQGLLQGAWIATQVDPLFTTRWKGSDNLWTPVDKAAVDGMQVILTMHIDLCFQREEALFILADGAATPEAVNVLYDASLNIGWPT